MHIFLSTPKTKYNKLYMAIKANHNVCQRDVRFHAGSAAVLRFSQTNVEP